MLDSVTKKRIDDLRNILVGKIPSPQSQVEQITTGLIYKFMHDMDNEAIEMGGVASFFIDEYEKYSWKHLFDPKLGGVEKVKLYSDAIENLYNNPHAPSIFREIFKNSFLPFKDASTLNMFLKEINEFHYSNSEKLGDAYEYLLSFMGSQGDAGQFRTPRHIIDFIIQIVNPKKDETILDPACGTSGFLISSYKHILNQNTQTRIGDKLNASERKQIGANLVGYDIDPAMARISLVNMYLHNFANPNISEYDTLSSEDKWNEYFDVILANPPFFSPTGGIKPHSRFGVKSTRAEVLFVDYIVEHLKPNGRSGIIVPEGIIFQTGNAYKTLRKKLVKDCLVGVISLPAGVFQPYSGVKTSILILDKQLHQTLDKIFFAKVENDGFTLGTQRKPISKNDLNEVEDLIKVFYREGNVTNLEFFKCIEKLKIEEKDFTLSISAFESKVNLVSKFPTRLLTDLAKLERGTSITKKEVEEGKIPVIAGGKKQAYFHNVANRVSRSITISSSGAYAGYVSFHEEPIFASDCFTVISREKTLDQKFLFYLLKSKQELIYKMQTGGGQPHVYAKNFHDFEIPFPTFEIQKEIVDELDGYQRIINGCSQVIDNYKPFIDFDEAWELVELRELVNVNNGNTLTSFDEEGDLAGIKVSDMNLHENQVEIITSNKKVNRSRFNQKHILPVGSIVFPKRGAAIATNKKRITRIPCVIDNNCMGLTIKSKRVLAEYLFNFLCSFDLTTISKSAGIPLINNPDIFGVKIPLPTIDLQSQISNNIKKERELISGNKKLVDLYQRKIKDKLSKIWGE